MLVIGTRQQVLLVLVHEAIHSLLFSKRWMNDLVSDLLSRFPWGSARIFIATAIFGIIATRIRAKTPISPFSEKTATSTFLRARSPSPGS